MNKTEDYIEPTYYVPIYKCFIVFNNDSIAGVPALAEQPGAAGVHAVQDAEHHASVIRASVYCLVETRKWER